MNFSKSGFCTKLLGLCIDRRLVLAMQQSGARYIVDSNPGKDRNRSTSDECQNRILSQEQVKDYRQHGGDVADEDELLENGLSDTKLKWRGFICQQPDGSCITKWAHVRT